MSTTLPTTEYPTIESVRAAAEALLARRLHARAIFGQVEARHATPDMVAFCATPIEMAHLLELERAGSISRATADYSDFPAIADQSNLFLGAWNALRSHLESRFDEIQARVNAERAA